MRTPMSEAELNRRVRAARNLMPDDPAWSEDYPLDGAADWPDAPHPDALPACEQPVGVLPFLFALAFSLGLITGLALGATQ